MLLLPRVRRLFASQCQNTASTLEVVDEASMDSRGANEAVSAIYSIVHNVFRKPSLVVDRSADDLRLVDQFFVSHSMRVECKNSDAVGWTSESQTGVGERSALIAVDTTSISVRPVLCTATQACGTAVARDLSCEAATSESETKTQQPQEVHKCDQEYTMGLPGRIAIQYSQRRMLQLGKVWCDGVYARRLRALDPCLGGSPCSFKSWWYAVCDAILP
jgi:hypothetical protein